MQIPRCCDTRFFSHCHFVTLQLVARLCWVHDKNQKAWVVSLGLAPSCACSAASHHAHVAHVRRVRQGYNLEASCAMAHVCERYACKSRWPGVHIKVLGARQYGSCHSQMSLEERNPAMIPSLPCDGTAPDALG